MTFFISGGAKNGKSTLAQNLAAAIAQGGKHYYVATMIPSDEEDPARIRHHIADRDGMGFETLECGRYLLSCLEVADRNGVFLVDSVTALLQNALFPMEQNYAPDLPAAQRCANDLRTFARTVRNAVFVSDYIYSDARRYDETTEMYRQCLGMIDRALAQECDTVIEVSAGQIIVHKGEFAI